MKKLRLFAAILIGSMMSTVGMAAVDPGTVSTYATDPALPIVDQAVTIYVNVNNWGITDTDTVTAYTGTVTTMSDSKTGWRNVKNSEWGDISIEMTKENDSIYSLQIPDINAFYGVPAEEDVVRITFIARGTKNGNVSGQTSDLFIDVFAEEPATQMSSLPAMPTDMEMIVVTFNINDTTGDVRDNHLIGYTDTVYVHTWLNDLMGAGTGSGAWPDNSPKFMCDAVNDSIRRFYVAPSTRGFYMFKENSSISSIGLLARSKDGSKQTKDYAIDVDSDVEIDLSMVSPIYVVPQYPTQDEPVYVYIDAKNYERSNGDMLDPASTLSAWSGLVTSASANAGDWLYQVNAEWGGFGDSTLFERVNDTIHRWVIPSFEDKYGVDLAEEDVFRLPIIARDTANGAVNKQTDDIYIEIFGAIPMDTTHVTQPAILTQDDAFVVTFNPEEMGDDNTLFPLLDTNMADTIGVWAHTGLSLAAYRDDVKNFQNVLTDWGENTSETEAVVVSSNLVRYFVFPESRTMYDVADSLQVIGLDILLRNGEGNAQTADLHIPYDTTGYNLGLKPDDTGINTFTKLEGVSVYPNPVQDVLTIEFDKAQTATITIVNAVGQLVYSTSISDETQHTINVAEFARNQEILFYTIKTEDKILTQKLLVY